MVCPFCGRKTGRSNGVAISLKSARFRRSNRVVPAEWWSYRPFICFEHFSELDLIRNDKGKVIRVRHGASPINNQDAAKTKIQNIIVGKGTYAPIPIYEIRTPDQASKNIKNEGFFLIFIFF